MTATVVGIIAPLLPFIWPPPPAGQKKTTLPITLKKALDQIPENTPVKFQAPSTGAFVMATGAGNNAPGDLSFGGYVVNLAGKTHVFSITCSHLGCSIGVNQGAKTFDCPCHGSRFNFNGTVHNGPATAPLATYHWKPGSKPEEILIDGLTLPAGG
ncbi:MAG: Rieske 2Fe-2S domain-containing protein [Candidatus Dormibacteraceae bacterium]